MDSFVAESDFLGLKVFLDFKIDFKKLPKAVTNFLLSPISKS